MGGRGGVMWEVVWEGEYVIIRVVWCGRVDDSLVPRCSVCLGMRLSGCGRVAVGVGRVRVDK